MTVGLLAILAALAVATALGLYWRSRNGRVVSQRGGTEPARAAGVQGVPGDGNAPVAGRDGLSRDDLGAPLGTRATLVQFSSSFCAPCRTTRQILSEVAGMTDGVTHVEIDAESRLDLVRRLDVRRTPTTFVLGPDGLVTHRASGQPRKTDVMAALGVAL